MGNDDFSKVDDKFDQMGVEIYSKIIPQIFNRHNIKDTVENDLGKAAEFTWDALDILLKKKAEIFQ